MTGSKPGPGKGTTFMLPPCTACGALAGACALTCRTLRLTPGWYERVARSNDTEEEVII